MLAGWKYPNNHLLDLSRTMNINYTINRMKNEVTRETDLYKHSPSPLGRRVPLSPALVVELRPRELHFRPGAITHILSVALA